MNKILLYQRSLVKRPFRPTPFGLYLTVTDPYSSAERPGPRSFLFGKVQREEACFIAKMQKKRIDFEFFNGYWGSIHKDGFGIS